MDAATQAATAVATSATETKLRHSSVQKVASTRPSIAASTNCRKRVPATGCRGMGPTMAEQRSDTDRGHRAASSASAASLDRPYALQGAGASSSVHSDRPGGAPRREEG